MTTLKVKRVYTYAHLPTYQSAEAAGLDLYACLQHPLIIPPGKNDLVPTGIMVELPFGFEGQIRPRSGLAKNYGVTILNSPGTLDSDYRGEISVLLINTGSSPFAIHHGDRVAQMVIAPVVKAQIVETNELRDTVRGEGGWGSSGV